MNHDAAETCDDFSPPPAPAAVRREPPAPRRTAAPVERTRELPHNLQAELAVLSCILVDPKLALVCLSEQKVRPQHFYSPANRLVFEAMLELADAGELPEPISLSDVLRRKGDLDAVGGDAAIENLASFVETTAHWNHFVRIIHEKHALREGIRKATAFVERAYEIQPHGEDLATFLAEIGQSYENGRKVEFLARAPSSFTIPPDDDPSILLGRNRYVCAGDGGVLVSTSGSGKSSLSIMAAYHWSLGRPFLGIPCSRPLRILIVQSEDADGDVAECCESCRRAMNLTVEQSAQVDERICIIRDKINRGDTFIRALEQYVKAFPPDIVVINPLHAYAGCDISDAKELGRFLREGLNRVNLHDRFAYWIIHHTPKPPVQTDKVKPRQWNEVMYEAAGSAELVNWARFIMTLKARATPGHFDLVLAKRGQRAGVMREVTTEYGAKFENTTTIPIRYSNQKFELPGHRHPIAMIFWEPLDEAPVAAPVPEPAAPKKPARGRGPADTWDRGHIIKHYPVGEANARPIAEIRRRAEEGDGVPRSTFHRIASELLKDGVILQTADLRWFRLPSSNP